MKSRDLVGDGLENHHAPQKALARNTVPGYPQDALSRSGPAIRLTKAEHDAISSMQKANEAARRAMTPNQLMADDVRMLRTLKVPNAQIQKLIDMYRTKYGQ